MSDFNFASASQAAQQHLETPATPVVETPTPEAEGQTPATEGDTPTDTPTPPPAPNLKQIFKVTENGQEVEVTLEDMLSGHLRHRDYTKKTMDLAEQRKQVETMVKSAQERETKINSFLRDADQVSRYYTFLTGQQVTPQQAAQVMQQQGLAPQGFDPSQMRQEMHQELQNMQQSTQQELAKVQQVVYQQQEQELNRDISGHIKGILADDKFKILEDLGDFEEVSEFLCAKATRLGPVTNIAQAKAAILQVAQAQAERLNDRRKEMLKSIAVKQQKLTTNTPEPPGGTGITPAPASFKLGDKALTAAATAFISGMGKK